MAPEVPAFCAFDLVSLSPFANHGGNGQKPPALARNIPVLQSLSAETSSITTAARWSQSCDDEVNLRQAVNYKSANRPFGSFVRRRI
jgi:hypothetical protein